MKKNKSPSLIKRVFVVYSAILLLAVISFVLYFSNVLFKDIQDVQLRLYSENMNQNLQKIQEHFDNVTSMVDFLHDNTALCADMKETYELPIEEIEAKDLYDVVKSPLQYQTNIANLAINCITIYSNDTLAFYSKHNSSVDQALARCETINLLYREPTRTGEFVHSDTPNGYIYWVSTFTDIYTGRDYGKIIIEVAPIETITSTNEKLFPTSSNSQLNFSMYPNTEYFVYNRDGVVLFSSDLSNANATLNYVIPPNNLSSTGRVISSDENYAVEYYINSATLFASTITPYEVVHEQINEDIYAFILFAIIIFIVFVIAGILVFNRIFAPLFYTNQYCNAFKEFPDVPPTYNAEYTEIEAIKSVINQSLKSNAEMRDVLMKNHIKMKDNEIQLLQSQINPHFLFNMLDIIGWKAAQDNSQASQMIDHLGGLLRSNVLLNNQEKITLQQEVTYIKNYLELQQIRFDNKFTYLFNFDEDLLDECYIPKLSLQPLVENSVIHAFVECKTKGKIEIRIWEDLNDIICSIKDNGIGFDADGYFDKEPVSEPDDQSGNTHVALRNIQKRIKMLYGEKYGMTIRSKKGHGTEILVIFPIDHNK